MAPNVIPYCYEAYRNAETSGWHLLLEDLTESHAVATQWPLPPTRQQCESIVRAHARLHAFWWDDPRLGVSVGTWLDPDAMDRQMQLVASDFQRFADRVGDLLSLERRRLYELLLGSAPRLLQRYHSHRDATITQGDAHVWNTFLPRDHDPDDVRLFDWDSWRLDFGSRDLARMMASTGILTADRRWSVHFWINTISRSWPMGFRATTDAPSKTTTVGRCFGKSRHPCGRL